MIIHALQKNCHSILDGIPIFENCKFAKEVDSSKISLLNACYKQHLQIMVKWYSV